MCWFPERWPFGLPAYASSCWRSIFSWASLRLRHLASHQQRQPTAPTLRAPNAATATILNCLWGIKQCTTSAFKTRLSPDGSYGPFPTPTSRTDFICERILRIIMSYKAMCLAISQMVLGDLKRCFGQHVQIQCLLRRILPHALVRPDGFPMCSHREGCHGRQEHPAALFLGPSASSPRSFTLVSTLQRRALSAVGRRSRQMDVPHHHTHTPPRSRYALRSDR